MTQRLAIEPHHTVLEIGTGSGYQTAILAQLAREVYTVERIKPLLDLAFERLMELGARDVHFRYGDGTLGWPESAPFDRILIGAAAPQAPEAFLLSQLKDNGIAVLPIGGAEEQVLIQLQRRGDQLHREDICGCRFVKLLGREGWEETTEK